MTESVAGEMLARATGSLLGQLIGDALGGQVEFQSARQIAAAYPDGVRELRDGGTWQTVAGQPTDDSEMALMLARSIVRNGRYDAHDVLKQYEFWLDSEPFDVGGTIRTSLLGLKNPDSQANGALMRICPVGIFGAALEGHEVAEIARLDAALTHPNPVCLDANDLYARAIAAAVRQQTTPQELYQNVARWAQEMNCDEVLKVCIDSAATAPPDSYSTNQGWVKIAFWNALYHLLHSSSFEEALVETVMCGGDTDTNAAIAGALLGAVYGLESIPDRWVRCVLNCRPEKGISEVCRPRPEVMWPVDALELAEALLLARPEG